MTTPATDQDTEPKAVEGGSGLIPYIHRDLVASITVHRIMTDEAGREHPFCLPRRFTPEDDEVTLAEYAGGGVYRLTARGAGGRFIQGQPARRIYIDGPEKALTEAPPPGAQPPAPPPPAAPVAPAVYAATAVPVASALPGMPTATLDIAGLSPEMRAFLGPYAAQQSYVYQAVMGSAKMAIDAVQRGADGQIEIARDVLKAITGPRIEADGAAIKALSAELGELRAALGREQTAHGETRGKLASAAVECARQRVQLEMGGQLPAQGTVGWRGSMERIGMLAVDRLGIGMMGLVAAQLGIDPGTLRELTAAAVGPAPAAKELPAHS